MRIYKCTHCGKMIYQLEERNVLTICCDESMSFVEANKKDASLEKHLPKVEQENNIVKVEIGEVLHPATIEHHIEWILIETTKGHQLKRLDKIESPIANFALENDDLISVYAYCNLHGLWQKEIK